MGGPAAEAPSIVCEYRLTGGLQRKALRNLSHEIPAQELLPLSDLSRSNRRRNRLGWWWSSTTTGHVGFANAAQERCLLSLDADPLVSCIVHQPLVLAGTAVEVQVDYAVVRAGKPGVVVLGNRACVEDPSEPLIGAFCEKTGWHAVAVPSPSEAELRNLRWLAGFRQPYKRDDRAISAILRHFADGASLASMLDQSDEMPTALPTIYNLLWNGALHVDLEQPLDRQSLIWTGR